ncbi:MAG TPA: hypothetical protein VFQ45_09885 [Longimicrobium sp.]|nr:hypothetical protein [Longimicrobium sp.]
MPRAARTAFALLLAAGPAAAQTGEPRYVTPGWFGLGVGVSTVGLFVELDAAQIWEPNAIRARITLHDSQELDVAREPVTVEEYALLYGYARRYRRNWGAAWLGLSLVEGSRNDVPFRTVGIPLEAQVVSRDIPFGVTVLANLNRARPFAAVGVMFPLGRR